MKWVSRVAGAAMFLSAASAQAMLCTADQVPAATVLVPYFVVDTSDCGNEPDRNSKVILGTISGSSVNVRLTIWSNAGVPVQALNLTLVANGTLDVDLRQLVCDGAIPGTTVFLGTDARDELVRLLTGQPSSMDGQCAALPPETDGIAEGYITVDYLNSPTSLDPSDPAYYTSGALGLENVLYAETRVFDFSNNASFGYPAVAIEAASGVFAPGNVTFYGRYNNQTGADGREPLATVYSPRFFIGEAPARTALIAWRETDGDGSRFTCGSPPGWFPLTLDNHRDRGRGLVALDESGDSVPVQTGPAFPRAAQQVSIAALNRFDAPDLQSGSFLINFQHRSTEYGTGPFGQAWVAATSLSLGRVQTALPAVALDNACNQGQFFQLPKTRDMP